VQELHVYQAIWGMENLSVVDIERDVEGALDLIQAAGFDGVGTSLMRPERCEAVSKGVRERGMEWEASAFLHSPDELARAIDRAHELGAHHLNVQILARPDRVADAVALLSAFEAHTAQAPFPVHYETHRGRLTNDLLFTLRVLQALPELKLTGDLSHYPLVHEFPLPIPPADLERISEILAHCWAFHGRVCGSHQVQVSLELPQHQDWVAQFRRWWAEGFASWRERADADGVLTFLCELGPPNYAITGPDGRELVDRWREAQLMKDMARSIWTQQALA
jgi:hypothetical protein